MGKFTKNQDTDNCFVELFPVKSKQVELTYTGKDISSDGGLLLLKEVECQIDIIWIYPKNSDGKLSYNKNVVNCHDDKQKTNL